MPNRPPTHKPFTAQTSADKERERKRIIDKRRGSAHKRGYDAKWRKIRLRVLAEEPLCRFCIAKKPSVVKAAEVVDHITPLSQGGTHDRENLRPLCASCHNRHTAKEQGFAKRK